MRVQKAPLILHTCRLTFLVHPQEVHTTWRIHLPLANYSHSVILARIPYIFASVNKYIVRCGNRIMLLNYRHHEYIHVYRYVDILTRHVHELNIGASFVVGW